MMRSKLVTVLAVASAFVLVACSSNGAAGNGTSTTASSGTPTTSSAPQPSATSSAGGAPSSAAGGGSSEQQSSDTESQQSSDTGSQESSATGSTDQSTITVGGNVDAQTATWFSAFCSGMSPMLDAAQGSVVPTGAGADLQATMVKEFSTLGDAMTNTANALKPLPPPTFSNGTQFATDVVNSLSQAGPLLKSAAATVQAVSPTDMSGLETAIAKASESLSSSMSTLSKYSLDKNTQTAMKNIPACAAFAAEADDSGSSTTG